MATLDDYIASRSDGRTPKIIARSFWGFDPGWASLIGFTQEAYRTWFMATYAPGDLALIYGADGEHANPAHIGRVLGFIEVENRPIQNVERMTPDAVAWTKANKLEGRWTFALPIKRAWRATGPSYELRHVAAETFGATEGRLRGSRGVLLTEAEAREVLKIKVRPANVYLEPAVEDDEAAAAAPLFTFFLPSKALPPSGPTVIEDGPRQLYLSRFKGAASLLLPGYASGMLNRKTLVKVGLSKDAEARRAALNQGFPEAARQFGFYWECGLTTGHDYPDYATAVAAETDVKQALTSAPDDIARSVGGEFFLVDWERAQSIFLSLTVPRDRIIAASSRRR